MESKPKLDIFTLIHFRNRLKITRLQEAPESMQLSKVETLEKTLWMEAAK